MLKGIQIIPHIEGKEFSRSNLAVKEDWKPDINRVNTYEVIKPLLANIGEVGPQVDILLNRYLAGGSDQLEMRVSPSEQIRYIKLMNTRKVE